MCFSLLPSDSNYIDKKVHVKRGTNEPYGFGVATTEDTDGRPPQHIVSVVHAGVYLIATFAFIAS